MKVVILAGGQGTRLGSVTDVLPKPMVSVGGKPMLWHIMKIYSHYGFNEFIICLGYKGEVIRDYFANFRTKNSDFTVDIKNDSLIFHNEFIENWKVTLVDTGLNNLKGSRVKQIERYLDSDINMLTYGDGVSNVDINALLSFHNSNANLVTVTGVRPPSMFGEIKHKGGKVVSFEEKPQTSKGLINGGFMVFNKLFLNNLKEEESCDLEFGIMEKLALDNKVGVFKHDGFWECADTVRDIENLNRLWAKNKAEWKVW